MGVPNEVYTTKPFILTPTDSVKKAIYLQNTFTDSGDGYFNLEDSIEQRKAKICNIFKLDGLLTAVADDEKGFIGYVKLDGNNIQYHSVSRYSKGKVFENEFSHILLTDTGLNTLPNILSASARSFLIQGGVKITAIYKSAYYLASSDYGFYFKLLPHGDKVKRSFAEPIIPQKGVVNKVDFLVDAISSEELVAGNFLEITPYIVNEEGEYQHTPQVIEINPYVKQYKYSDSQFTSISTAANAMRNDIISPDDSIGLVGFSTFYRNPVFYPNNRARVYKPIKTPSEIGREYLMSDMGSGTNGLLGYFQDETQRNINGDLFAETFKVEEFDSEAYITEFLEYRFDIFKYFDYYGEFQISNQYGAMYDEVTTYNELDIIEDVKEYMKTGFDQNDWENPSTTNSLRANTNYYLKRYVEGGITKYLWDLGSSTKLATGFIVFSDFDNPSNYR